MCPGERAKHPAADVVDARGLGAKNAVPWSAQKRGNITATIRNVDQIDTGHHLELFAEDMRHGPAAGRSHVDLARIPLGVGNELRDRLGWNGWIDHHDIEGAANARDRRDIADEIEIELLAERRVHRVRHSDEQERIAVRRCPDDAFSADVAAGTRSVLNDKWLPEPLRQRLTHETGDGVGCLACGKGDDDAHRPRRIGSRPRDPRYGRHRGSAGGQMQEFTAGRINLLTYPFRFTTHSTLLP